MEQLINILWAIFLSVLLVVFQVELLEEEEEGEVQQLIEGEAFIIMAFDGVSSLVVKLS